MKSETDSERIFTCDAGVDAAHMKVSKACQRRLKAVTAVKMARIKADKTFGNKGILFYTFTKLANISKNTPWFRQMIKKMDKCMNVL